MDRMIGTGLIPTHLPTPSMISMIFKKNTQNPQLFKYVKQF